MALETEFETFNKRIAEIEQHEGTYVLIHGEELIDYFEAYADAIKAGYAKFGLEPFLVKQVNGVQEAHFITRYIEPIPLTPVAH